MNPGLWHYLGSALLIALYLGGVVVVTGWLLHPANAVDWATGGLLVAIVGGMVTFLVLLGWYWLAVALGSVFA